MVKTKVGITLSEETVKRLEEIMQKLGLTKSQAISLLINTYSAK